MLISIPHLALSPYAFPRRAFLVATANDKEKYDKIEQPWWETNRSR